MGMVEIDGVRYKRARAERLGLIEPETPTGETEVSEPSTGLISTQQFVKPAAGAATPPASVPAPASSSQPSSSPAPTTPLGSPVSAPEPSEPAPGDAPRDPMAEDEAKAEEQPETATPSKTRARSPRSTQKG